MASDFKTTRLFVVTALFYFRTQCCPFVAEIQHALGTQPLDQTSMRQKEKLLYGRIVSTHTCHFWKKSLPLSSTNKSREVHDVNFPDGFHAQLGVLQHFHFFDAVFRQNRGRPTDRPQVKAAVFLAGHSDLLAAVAFRQHHHRATRSLENTSRESQK